MISLTNRTVITLLPLSIYIVQSIVKFSGLFVSYLLQQLLNLNDPTKDGFILSDFFFFVLFLT